MLDPLNIMAILFAIASVGVGISAVLVTKLAKENSDLRYSLKTLKRNK